MRSRVSWRTAPLPERAFETVEIETPARAATSPAVTRRREFTSEVLTTAL
jgi:hypothetical protein